MKPHFHKVPTKPENSFSIRKDVLTNFETTWHYHPELELHYIHKGEGLRFIGDDISNFSSDEMLLLGENLPHTWKCKDGYSGAHPGLPIEVIVMHFLPNCLGQELLSLPEAFQIPQLFEKAKKGMIIYGETKKKILALMEEAYQSVNLKRLTLFLSILSTLAESEEYENITSAHTFYKSNQVETDRINTIYTYTLKNYMNEISLEEIASLSGLSITSFCRYFKLMTHKTYYDFLTEIRLSHACRILIQDDKQTIEAICAECGFNNASNFYRHFKKVTGYTPMEYKRKYVCL